MFLNESDVWYKSSKSRYKIDLNFNRVKCIYGFFSVRQFLHQIVINLKLTNASLSY